MRLIGLAVILTAGLTFAPLAIEAQQAGKVPRIGVLHAGTSHTQSTEAFRRGLRDLGYVEGRTLAIEWRWAEGKPDRYPALAAELVSLGVDVIVAAHAETTMAAKQATRTIPIVMAASGDAVGAKLVTSLARPGGNVTGLSLMISELAPKRLELLKEIVPDLSRVALFWNPESLDQPQIKNHQAAARSLGLEELPVAVRGPSDFIGAFQVATQRRCGAVVTVQNPLFALHRARLAELALKSRLPMMSGEPGFTEAGGLVTYGPSLPDSWRRAATYVDKILKGAKPADLPVEQPTKFELVINMKTAKALGLTIPQSVLVRADEIIQ
jgi:putative ABC transport system substrate-binding protein